MGNDKRLLKRNEQGEVRYATPCKGNSVQELYEEEREKDKAIMEKLCNLEDKFENGKAFELPCNVGDAVWFINTRATLLLAENTVYEGRVVRFHVLNFPKPNGTSVCADIQIRNKQGTTEFPNVKDFGKVWFLSKEEADARLEEIKKGDKEDAINTWQ